MVDAIRMMFSSRRRFTSFALVAVQFAALAYFALTGPWLARAPFWLAIECTGIALGLWAVAAMRLGNFNLVPDVKPSGRLIHRGPYRWIRHPMYLALLLTTLPLVVTEPSGRRMAVWLILLVDLLVKIAYEERLLAAHFPEYADYQAQTKRLLPFIY